MYYMNVLTIRLILYQGVPKIVSGVEENDEEKEEYQLI